MGIVTVGINSWISIADAQDYFEDKYGADEWLGLTTLQKTQLLITSYNMIQQQTWVSIPANATATIIKQAQCEFAWYIYKYWAEHEKRQALYDQGVTDFTISEFSETLKGAQFPLYIKYMLIDYWVGVGGTYPVVTRELESND